MSLITPEPFNREKQHAQKRRAVIRSATQNFRKHGYHNTSMTDIAKALGLTKAALYYYVNTKEEILFECHQMVYDAMDEVLNQSLPSGLSGLDSLCEIFSRLVKLMTQDGLSVLTDVGSLTDTKRQRVLDRRAQIEDKITQYVQEGIKDESIRASDPRLMVYFFMGALNWLNAWYDPDGRMNGDEITRQFTLQMRSGISATSVV